VERELPQKVTVWQYALQHPDPKLQADHDRYQAGKTVRLDRGQSAPEVLNANTKLALTQISG